MIWLVFGGKHYRKNSQMVSTTWEFCISHYSKITRRSNNGFWMLF
nr:MAG TPA: hypothetical protein [Caudoviricetes sp.]